MECYPDDYFLFCESSMAQTMKLLCVIPSYWPAFEIGGPVFSVHQLLKTLVKRGVEVTVYTTNVGLGGRVTVNRETGVDGVRVTYFSFYRAFEFLGNYGWQLSLSLSRALRRTLPQFDLVYIVSVWNYPTVIAWYYCRKYNKPYILSPRGSLDQYTLGKKAWKKLPYYYFLARRILQEASCIHYTSRLEERWCHGPLRLKSRPVVIPNGLAIEDFSSLPDKGVLIKRYPNIKDKEIILFLGRLNWKKGLDILLKAFAVVCKEREGLHLLVVGDGERRYAEGMKKWVCNHQLSDKVTFLGFLSAGEKLSAFAATGVFVLPSYSENFGMAVLEAMACGLPVVITERVGIFEDVADAKAGIVIKPDTEGLILALRELLHSPQRCRQMGEAGKRLVREKFSLDSVAEKMIDFFGSIVASGRNS